jgi:hypothetical protein
MGGSPLPEQKRERLVALAAQIAAENDPVKFHALVLELNQMLNKKKKKMANTTQAPVQKVQKKDQPS